MFFLPKKWRLLVKLFTIVGLSTMFMQALAILDQSVSLIVLREQGVYIKPISFFSEMFGVSWSPTLFYHFSLACLLLYWLILSAITVYEIVRDIE